MFSKSLKVMAASVAMSAIALGASAHEVRAEHAATNDWTGPYIGAIIGFGTVEATVDAGVFNQPEVLSDYGFMGGLTVGWNAQDGHIVYGIEGDVSFGEIDATLAPFSSASIDDLTLNTDLFATIRGRAGVASNDIFLYGTAGLAILDGDVSSSIGGASEGFTALGGVVGAGAELAITQDVSFKAELLYAFFDEDVGLAGIGIFGGGDSLDIDEFYTVRFGVNWHF